MSYRKAFFKICVAIALFIGLGVSVAQAAGGNFCPAGSRCNPVMEGWCRQNEKVLSQHLQGKTLKSMTTLYPLGAAEMSSVPNYYNYSSSINCGSKYCCFTSTLDKLVGSVSDIIKKAKDNKYTDPDKDPNDSGKDGSTDQKKVQDMPHFLMAILDKNNAAIDCWLCGLLEEIFVLGDGLATRLYSVMRDSMLAILGIFTVFVMMWMVVKVFIDFTGKSARSFLQQISGFLVRVLVAILILTQSPSFIGEWIMGPFINFSVGMGAQFMSDEDNSQSAHINYFSEHYAQDDSVMGCIHQKNFWETKTDLMFPKSTCNAVVGLVQLISIELSTPIQYGQALMSYGWQNRVWHVFPRFPEMISGMLMVFFFILLLVFVPFKVIDIFAQLACVGCLLPLAVVLFVFPTTRKYTKNMWQLFLACVIQLMVLSLMVSIVISLFTASMSYETNKSVLAFFLEGKDKEAAELLRMGGSGILMFIALALVSWKLIGQAGTFAQQLGGAVSLGLGEAMSGMVSWITSRVAGVAAAAVILGGSAAIEKAASKATKNKDKTPSEGTS